ncbi:MAG: Crp/Fnr family transcriptional regulator [Paracoccaceae bacterium]
MTMSGECFVPGELSENITAVAATPAVVCLVRAGKYHDFLQRSHDFRKQIYLQTRAKRDRARHLAFTIGNLGPEQRISAFYASCTGCMPWQPLPDGGGILSMEYERQDIAALLSTTVETVCRVLRRLDTAGVIRLRDSRHIEIRDLGKLLAHAGLAIPQVGEGLCPCAAKYHMHPSAMIAINAAVAHGR